VSIVRQKAEGMFRSSPKRPIAQQSTITKKR
jgi:hypothetical protein